MDLALNIAAGFLTKGKLAEAGAGPEAMKGATTTRLDLPTFGGNEGPPPGLEESRDIAHCEPRLRDAIPLIQQRFRAATGTDLFVTCTWRSSKRQNEYFKKIPKVTNIDGITKIFGPARPSISAWTKIQGQGRLRFGTARPTPPWGLFAATLGLPGAEIGPCATTRTLN